MIYINNNLSMIFNRNNDTFGFGNNEIFGKHNKQFVILT